MSGETTDSSDVFLFHKTTHRELYNRELARARASGFFDTLFCNERGELTEGAITNVYVKQHGVLFTPPLRCGVLAGTVRQSLLAAGKAREKVLTPSDLRTAEEVYVSNALVGTVAGYISKPCPAKPGFPSPAPSRT
jgi:para-aminobenzoate synthetase/4-amino-4-deoxychorismate lyase